MTDQQHVGMMSCAGNPHLKTPAMDRLARDGIRFANAYAANPVCVPSRISMATGVMPGRLGVFSNGMKADVPLDVDAHSLGKLIKSAGYDTFYGGSWYSGVALPLRSSTGESVSRVQPGRRTGITHGETSSPDISSVCSHVRQNVGRRLGLRPRSGERGYDSLSRNSQGA